MLKLDQSESYWYPVVIELIDAEGKKKKFDFDAKFKRLDEDERAELAKKTGGDDAEITVRDLVQDIFIGWRKVQDSNGDELVVNDDNRSKLLKVEGIHSAILNSWKKSIGIEGNAKN